MLLSGRKWYCNVTAGGNTQESNNLNPTGSPRPAPSESTSCFSNTGDYLNIPVFTEQTGHIHLRNYISVHFHAGIRHGYAPEADETTVVIGMNYDSAHPDQPVSLFGGMAFNNNTDNNANIEIFSGFTYSRAKKKEASLPVPAFPWLDPDQTAVQ